MRPHQPAVFDTTPTLTRRFEQQAAQRPDAIALSCEGHTLSYAELNRRANQVARHLRRLGVGPEALVGLALERSLDLVVGLLGILKAGGAYLPIDLAYPRERMEFMLADAGARIVLTSAAARAQLPGHAGTTLCLDADWPTFAAEPDGDPEWAAAPDDLAYVIYTSGSTGQPKGCLVTQANVVRLFGATEAIYHFGADDVWTFFHSHAFDFSVWEIWGALLYGGRLVVVPPATSRSPEALHALLVRERVTVLNQTPSAFRALIQADASSGTAPEQLALRWVIFGGEALELQMLRPWFARHGDQRPRLVNMYGITETTVHVTWRPIGDADVERGVGSVIGQPLPDLTLHVLDEQRQPVAIGSEGEMYVGGAGVARGYLNRAELTAQRFIDWTDADGAPHRLYRTGDLARRLPDGDIEYLGRIDTQVKIRGFRIETGEIESALMRHPGVRACAVIARDDAGTGARLVAYRVPSQTPATHGELRTHLATTLPDYMLPAAIVDLDHLPLTGNGKLDRRALPSPGRGRPEHAGDYMAPQGETERRVCAVLAEALELDRVGRHDNFFLLGGNSLLAVHALERLRRAGLGTLPVTRFFQDPTPAALAAALGGAASGFDAARLARRREAGRDEPIAIVAMAGRFPGAGDVETFWRNLCDGRDTITHFAADGLDPAVPDAQRNDPAYVRARGLIDGVELFDAAFFGIAPREAELMDPQQRVFLELCWECLERGGHAPGAHDGLVGVWAGMFNATYGQHHVAAHPELVDKVGAFQVMLGNEKDFIATRVAHKLDLTGPAVSVHTACSTSLVAICQAVDALRGGHCDMALAGGVAITCPPRSGYLHQAGAMLSPDGATRTFDADAGGTVFSDGAAVLLLKRLADAQADGDPVIALIRGGAVNNDGATKASFTAPSSDGQAAVIAMALDAAGVDARSLSYVEAHGTATPVGDPIEIEGLTRAFRRHTAETGFCRIGSVKSNVGHLTIAAGAAGVIKTAFALAERKLPPSLHFRAPNPAIDFAASPFVVNDTLHDWEAGATPRRAGVSSFGVGGTNAHVVMEEAPAREASMPAEGPQLLRLSARTPGALAVMATQLADHLEAHPALNLADAAWTLAVGRKAFGQRLALVAEDVVDAVARLRIQAAAARGRAAQSPDVVFLFPGQGAQYPGMGRELHRREPVFRAAFDECADALGDDFGFDLRERCFADDAEALLPTAVMQPATFALEYALARWWMSLGVAPSAMLGHSVGEFAAATLAGVFAPADAARLVARRGQLMQAQPAGAMLSVRLAVAALGERLPAELALAAENAPGACVVAGPTPAIARFQAELEREGIACRPLRTSHAFHSPMMDAAVEPFRAAVAATERREPLLAIVSSVTGAPLAAAEAMSPDYWARQLREPVRFAPALRTLLDAPARVLLEVGPRAVLGTLARQQLGAARGAVDALASLADAPATEHASLLAAAGEAWCRGIAIDPAALDRRARRHRLVLPTYPFERQRHWVEAAPASRAPVPAAAATPPPSSEGTPMSSPSASPMDRRPRLIGQLKAAFEEISGLDLAEADPSSHFIELGLDSLMLTQVALHLSKAFAVPVSFRQLMGEAASFAQLAALLDAQLPPEAATAPAPIPQQPPVAQVSSLPATTMPDGYVQQVIAQQMQLMAQQLALLNGTAVAPLAAPVPVPMPVSAPMPTPVAAAATAAAASDEETALAHTRYDVKKAFGAIARIDTGKAELSPRQQGRLDRFVERYVARTGKSKAYTEAHRPHMADPRVVSGFRPLTKEIAYPLVVERSKGAHLWDLDGNEYVDALNGFGMSLFGWQPDFVLDAIRRQLELGYEIGPQHPLAGEVAKLLCEVTGHERAALCNTGSEAVLGALRIARTVTGRETVALFTGSYHGINDEVIVRGTKKLRAVPAAPGILRNTAEHVLVLDYGTPESLQIIRERAHELAAVLIEPVQSRRPDFRPVEFLREVRAITEASGALCIFDEIVTGFRCHPGGTQALFDIHADLATYGKVIGGGYPIGAIAGRRAYMDALDGGQWQYGDDSVPTVGVTYFAGTFVRHPLALAAAKAVLEHLKHAGPALQERLNARTAAMADELNGFFVEVGAPIAIKQFASLWRTQFLEDHPLQDLLFAMMRSRGVHILDNFPCFFTSAHDEADFRQITEAYKASVLELQEAGFLPRNVPAAQTVMDAARPPLPGARLGREPDGRPCWFVPNPAQPGKYLKVES